MRRHAAIARHAWKVSCASAGICLLQFGCASEKPVQKPLTPVRVTAVSGSAAAGGVRYSASVTPNAQVNLIFKSGGYVESITQRTGADGRVRPLEAGDKVSAGEVLAKVRESDYTDRVSQAAAQVAQAKAAY